MVIILRRQNNNQWACSNMKMSDDDSLSNDSSTHSIKRTTIDEKREPTCQCKANVHRDWASMLRFIHSWDDDMFK